MGKKGRTVSLMNFSAVLIKLFVSVLTEALVPTLGRCKPCTVEPGATGQLARTDHVICLISRFDTDLRLAPLPPEEMLFT